MNSKRRSILLVGNFLSSATGTRGACEDLADQLEIGGWQVIRTSNKNGRLARLSDIVRTILLRRSNYDIAQVEVYSGLAFVLAEISCWLLGLLGKPVILTLHGGGLANFSRQYEKRVIRLLQNAAAVTTPSHFLKDELGGIRPDICYIPNGMTISAYEFVKRDRIRPDLAWLRAFHEIYSPLTAVKTIELLRGDFHDIHLTMYGPDKGDGSLQIVKNYIRENCLDKCIRIVGAIPKSHVPEALSHHNLFLNTTRLESFGVCVAEAAACGLPVVSTNVGEIPYLWKDGVEALLVVPDMAEAMSVSVRRILTEPGLAERLSLNARKKVEQFDWSNILPQWENIFTIIMQKQSGC